MNQPSPSTFVPASPDEIAPLLEMIGSSAAILDAQGNVWACNQAWEQDEFAPFKQRHSLADGWTLEVRRRFDGSTGDDQAQQSEAIKRLTRGLTHELRNPLSAILTAIDLLQDVPELGEENGMLLEVVRSESRRLSHILNEFSAYARPAISEPVAFDFAATVRHAVADLQRELARAEITVLVDDELPISLWVTADENQVRDALSRVLINARDAMSTKNAEVPSKLVLCDENSTSEGHHYLTICIKDSGPGFGQESSERAFEPFFSTKAHETGLGLSIARRALEATGGKLWIESPHSGQGAVVCLSLPAA